MSRLKRFFFWGILVAIALAGMEGAVRLLVAVIPRNPLVEPRFEIPDSRLGYTLNPNYPEHDDNGFRNKVRLTKADLVVLGDSQIYGFNIPMDRLWPQQLGELTGMRAYNMGVPGYGPVQSLFLVDQALDLGPAVVLEAFYSGNDLYDAYHMAYDLNDLADLKTRDRSQADAIAESERRQSLDAAIHEVSNYGRRPGESTLASKAKSWLNEHVMVYRMLRTVRDRLIPGPAEPKGPIDDKAAAERYPEDLLLAGPGVPNTIFTPRYRLVALNLGDPRIAEGLNVSLQAIERMSRRVAERGKCFAVMMVPTKEFVYGAAGDAPSSRAPSSATFFVLLERERAMWRRARSYFAQHGITYLDLGPALSERIRRGEAIYPTSTDGHPSTAGHDAIAQTVLHSGVCGLHARAP
jgi:SGNH hydrolase-like domain, acetyltransferase AlgX